MNGNSLLKTATSSKQKIITLLFFAASIITAAYVIMCVVSIFLPEHFNKINLRPGEENGFYYYVYIFPLFVSGFNKLSSMSFETAKRIAVVVAYLTPILKFGYIAAILYNLKKIFMQVSKNNVFSIENAKRIKSIAYIFWLYTFAELILIQMPFHQWKTNLINCLREINYSTLLTGFIFFILAGIFRYGCYLQTEYDETL